MHIEKQKMRIEILTNSHRILADIHIFSGARLTDILAAREAQSFIALTDVVVYDLQSGGEIFSADFININKNHIVMVRPAE